MASSIINSDDGVVSGTSGIKTTGGDDGVTVFQQNGTERIRIDTSGNLLVGSTSSTGYGPIQLGSTSASGSTSTLQFLTSTTNNSFIQFGDGITGGDRFRGWIQYGHNGDFMGFATAENERARITSDGDLLLGTTSNLYGPSRLQATDSSATGAFCFQGTSGTAGYEVGQIWKTNTSGDNKFLAWITEGGAGTERGSVSYNRAGNLVSYNTSSDYRLKENIIDLTGALATVARLQPRQFTWKETGNTTTGFIAHELAEVLPHAVTGEKDETEMRRVQVSPAVPATYDADGNELTSAIEAVYEEREVPKYQGVDTSFLVATLTAAIQELSAKNDALEARIAALEGAE